MIIIKLHDKLNPERIVPFDAADFSMALPQLGGSALRLKSSDSLTLVAETPEQIIALMESAGAL